MFTKQSSRARRHAITLLAIYVLALLLPVHIASAEMADSCDETTVLAAHLAVQPASADEKVAVPKEVVDRAAYTANWRYAYQGLDFVIDVLTMSIVTEAIVAKSLNEQRSQEIVAEVTKAIGDSMSNQARKFSADDAAHAVVDVTLKHPELQQATKKVVEDIANKIAESMANQPTYGSIATATHRHGIGESIVQNAEQVLNKIYVCAKKNPTVKKTVDRRNSSRTKSKIDDSAKDIATQNPDNPVLKELQKLVAENGELNLSFNELKEMSKSEFAKLNKTIDGMQGALVQIDEQQKDILQYLDNAEAREVVRAIREANAADYALTIQGLQSSTYILSTVLDFVKPGVGKQLSTTLNSAITIADSMKKWLDAIDTMQGLDKLVNMSTVVMTGNVLGAVMNVVSMFGPAQPTPEQMILEEIGKLRQQVSELRGEMHDRFDRIDKGLNSIYTTMQDRFDLIDIQLGKINGNIVEVQKSLIELDAKLSRMERNNFELINAVARRELVEAVNLGLGYEKRTGQPMPYTPNFDTFSNKLYTWITHNAYDAGSVGPSQRDYSDAALLSELNAYPLDTNINYLNGWLKANGLPALSSKPLPSPRDWLFATRAYVQLGIEEPEHMKALASRDPQRVAQMQSAAMDVESAARNIASLTTLSGTVGNSLLFSTVITHYQGKLDQLDGAIQVQESAFLEEVRSKSGISRTETFSLYGGIDQVLPYQAPGLQSMAQGESNELLPLPNNLTTEIPHLNRYILGEYLRISNTAQISVSMFAVLDNPRQVPGCIPDPDACPVMGDLRISADVSYGNTAILVKEFKVGRVTLPVIGADVESPTAYVVRNWGNLKPRFEANAVTLVPTAEQAQTRAELFSFVTNALETRLATYQQSLYKRVLDAMNIGTLRADAQQLAGSKLLLESFISLGLSQAVESDDVLRSMLYGEQQIVGDAQIMQSYALSATQPITQAALTTNPRILIGQLADKRSGAVNRIIDGYLGAITAKTHVESLDYLTATRRDLDLTMRMVQISDPQQPNPNTKQVFLPLVAR